MNELCSSSSLYSMENNILMFPPQCESSGVCAYFSTEPPKSHRKSNFFHFDLKLEGERGTPLKVTDARFAHFVNNGTPAENQNGIIYIVCFQAQNAPPHAQNFMKYLYVWLVDSETDELISYQGKFTDSRLRRVFLTHELDCARCMSHQSCGNINEMPANPVILTSTELRFHLKCNQNCLRASGNPKEVRRFKILITLSDSPLDKGVKIARSRRWFVHNNSKPPGGKKKKVQTNVPKIRTIIPKGGSTCSPFVVIGEHFHQQLVIYLNDTPLQTQMLTETALATVIPNLGISGARTVSLRSENEIYECDTPFHYVNPKYHDCRNIENCEICRNFMPIAPQMSPESVRHLQVGLNVPKVEPEVDFVQGNTQWTSPFHPQDMYNGSSYQYSGMYSNQPHSVLHQGVLPYSPPTSPPN